MSDVPRRFVVVVVGLGNEHYFLLLAATCSQGRYFSTSNTTVSTSSNLPWYLLVDVFYKLGKP